MMRMTQAINEQHLVEAANHGVEVTYVTCHHGNRVPWQLGETLMGRFQASDIDATLAAYRSLRQKYYGRAAYDFGKNTLVEVGNTLSADRHHAAAIRIYKENLEHFPNSVYTHVQIGRTYGAIEDTASALKHLKKALEIQLKSRWIKKLISELKN